MNLCIHRAMQTDLGLRSLFVLRLQSNDDLECTTHSDMLISAFNVHKRVKSNKYIVTEL